jgi:hypothetical protein
LIGSDARLIQFSPFIDVGVPVGNCYLLRNPCYNEPTGKQEYLSKKSKSITHHLKDELIHLVFEGRIQPNLVIGCLTLIMV